MAVSWHHLIYAFPQIHTFLKLSMMTCSCFYLHHFSAKPFSHFSFASHQTLESWTWNGFSWNRSWALCKLQNLKTASVLLSSYVIVCLNCGAQQSHCNPRVVSQVEPLSQPLGALHHDWFRGCSGSLEVVWAMLLWRAVHTLLCCYRLYNLVVT